MTSIKIRHEFLADADVTEQLNELVQNRGVTKTDIIIQALKTFSERGIENEFSQRTAKRFETLSRELETVRHGLAAVKKDLEVAHHTREKMQSDVTMILQSLVVFVRFSMTMSANIPPLDKNKQALGHERLRWFTEQVDRRIAAAAKPAPSPQNDKGES
jgi:hypothetical protein